jgi:hypothetical protein
MSQYRLPSNCLVLDLRLAQQWARPWVLRTVQLMEQQTGSPLETQMAQRKARPTGQQLVRQKVRPRVLQKDLQSETQLVPLKEQPSERHLDLL